MKNKRIVRPYVNTKKRLDAKDTSLPIGLEDIHKVNQYEGGESILTYILATVVLGKKRKTFSRSYNGPRAKITRIQAIKICQKWRCKAINDFKKANCQSL